jgi:TonB family protein
VVLAASVSRELAKRKTLSMTVDFVKHPVQSIPPPSQPFEQAEYQGADYHGLSPELLRRVEGVLSKVRTGQRLTDEQWSRIIKEVSALDSKLSVSRRTFSTAESATGFAVRLRVQTFSALFPDFITIMDLKLANKPEPEYPPQARRAKIQGTVRFRVEVGKDGTVQTFELLSGHPLLVPAAVSALRQYRYQPVRLDGEPVNVVTQVDINFTFTR